MKSTNKEFPFELNGKIDPQLYARIIQVFSRLQQLEQQQASAPLQTQAVVQQQLRAVGLIGIYGQLLIGISSSDPQLSELAASPGTGTVTTVTGSGDTNVTVTITNPSTVPNVGVTLSLTPTFTTVNAGVGGYKVSGTKVVGAQGASVPDAAGGATIDAEARTAINDLLARLRTHGLIA